MKKVALVGIALVIGWLAYRQLTASPFRFTDSHEENVGILRQIVAEVNRGLPKQLDEETTLVRVDVTNAGVVNRLRTRTLTSFDFGQPELQNGLRLALHKRVCANRGYKKAMGKGFSISYAYSDPNNLPIGAFTYRRADCIGL